MLLKPTTKAYLRKLGRRFGLEIRPSGVNSRDDLRFIHFIRMHKIDTVIDVGANRGQFARGLFDLGFEGRIISIEPLPEAHRALEVSASQFGSRWTVAPRLALSDTTEGGTLFVTQSDTASSLLQPTEALNQATPSTEVVERIPIETAKLDDLVAKLNLNQSRVLLKLDVQGGEDKVLAGAANTIHILSGLLIELSFADLYSNQTSPAEIFSHMTDVGFELWDLWRGYSNPQTHRLNQIDALFFRSK